MKFTLKLYNFFKRYYSEGDFMSLRRYKEGVYALPYEGEEVKLHWANHDQYYIKTSENLKNYSFKTVNGKKHIRFELVAGGTETNNNKAANGKERRFILHEESPIQVNGDELVIRFEYRADDKGRKQDAINKEIVEKILSLPEILDFGLAEKAPTEKNKERTLLEKHLTDYTAKNSFDYFIHKDLGKFLSRELDFFIKNEIMYLDDIENETAPKVEAYLAKIKAMRKVARKIIQFLAQLENFQKKLWLKKKFVLETHYCVTLDHIIGSEVENELLPIIAENDAQREEWVKLFAIDELKGNLANVAYSNPLTVEFLKANDKLLVDTKFFDVGFKYTLLSIFDDLDEQTDGLLINSENFQALSFIKERYEELISCVHIDPPYNTQTSGFLYKNAYQHSSWLTMMKSRLGIAASLLTDEGSLQCHIDEHEYEKLFLLFDTISIPNVGTVVWDKRNPMLGRKGVATQHEYVIWRSNVSQPIYQRNVNVLSMLSKVDELIQSYGVIDESVRKDFSDWVASNKDLSGGEKAYKFIDDDGRIYRGVAMGAPETRTDAKYFIPLKHPTTGKNCPIPNNGFSRTPEKINKLLEAGLIIFGKDETVQPQKKVFLTADSQRQISSVISEGRRGKNDVDPMEFEFSYCHPVNLYELLIGCASSKANNHVLDYFAGSGTTGHAVINLNREDEGSRKYILVEMGTYFNTVLKPRIQKVSYSSDWKNGKPISREGVSQIIKYMSLEQYEDALDNLVLSKTETQAGLLNDNPALNEQYMLSYMLDVESRGSQSLLNIDAFANPFSYKLRITRNDDTQVINVDLIETFNYLLWISLS